MYVCCMHGCVSKVRGHRVSSSSVALSLMSWKQDISLSSKLTFSTRLAVIEPHHILLCLPSPTAGDTHVLRTTCLVATGFQVLVLMSVWKALFTSEPVKFLLMKIFKLLWWLSYDAQLFFLTLLFFLNFKTGSESSFLVKRKSNSIGVGEFSRDPVLQRCSPNSQRQSNSLVSYIVFMLSVWSWHSLDNWTPAKLRVIRRSYLIHKCILMKTY